MKDWKECKLEDFVEINPRESLPKNTIAKKIAMEVLEPFTKKISSFEETEYKGGVKFRNGDTIMARITPSLENGKTAYVDILNENEIGFGSTEFIVLREKIDISNKNFIYYLATSPELREIAIKSMTGSSGRQRVQTDVVKSYDILLPPLPEQTTIASILSSLDDKIDLLHRQNETLEKMAEALFRQWFVEKAEEDWEEVEFGNFLKPQKGKNLTKAKAIEGRYFVVAGGLEPMCTHNESNTEAPVITISASGANAGFVRLYHDKVWSSDSSYIDNTITPYVYFSYLFLKSNQKILFDKQTGSAQPHIYPQQIMELDFFKYPIHLIIEFENRCKSFFQKVKSNQTQIHTLTSLRDTLLPKLMSGEVRVECKNKKLYYK